MKHAKEVLARLMAGVLLLGGMTGCGTSIAISLLERGAPMNRTSINKVGWVHFLGFWLSTGALYFLLERYPQHRTAVWTGWALLVMGWVLALAISMAIRHRNRRRGHVDG